VTERRRLWLTFFCLPILTISEVPVRADGGGEAPNDLLTIWRTFSDAARQQDTADGAPNADAPDFSWSPASSGNGSPRLAPIAPTVPVLDPGGRPLLSGSESSSSSLWEQPDKKPRKVSQKSEGLLGSLSSQVEVTDTPVTIWDDPSWKRTWQTNESWQLGVAGSLAVFGTVGANSDEAGQSNMKVSGRTGLSCKLPVGSLAEFTFRSGPGVSYTDPLHPLRTQGRSDWLVEVQARWPLLFGIGLEYQGTALPSLTPLQQDMVNSDVRLAFPVGGSGKLKLGAKHQWTGLLDQKTPWTDSMQLYLGLELTR
jgi:hypothetical protein